MKKYLLVLITIPFFILCIRLLDRDIYYDEAYSLVNYILVPIKQTVFEYKNLNNHFFYSLICNLYLKAFAEMPRLTGDTSILFWLMNRPYMIRLPQLAFSGVTIYYLYQIGKLFNKRVALYSIVILMTTIPYHYYVTQVRGYSLSIMLITILVYYLWRKK